MMVVVMGKDSRSCSCWRGDSHIQPSIQWLFSRAYLESRSGLWPTGLLERRLGTFEKDRLMLLRVYCHCHSVSDFCRNRIVNYIRRWSQH
ncbi:unnamed protein product [Calypogeia fissa]